MGEAGNRKKGRGGHERLKAKRHLALMLLLGLWACSDPVCTLIGCHNGLLLTFDHTPEPGTIISIEGLEVPWSVECGVDVHGDCSRGVLFADFRLEHAIVRITTSEGEVFHEIWPEYVTSHPNGKNCEPECFWAEEVLELP